MGEGSRVLPFPSPPKWPPAYICPVGGETLTVSVAFVTRKLFRTVCLPQFPRLNKIDYLLKMHLPGGPLMALVSSPGHLYLPPAFALPKSSPLQWFRWYQDLFLLWLFIPIRFVSPMSCLNCPDLTARFSHLGIKKAAFPPPWRHLMLLVSAPVDTMGNQQLWALQS